MRMRGAIRLADDIHVIPTKAIIRALPTLVGRAFFLLFLAVDDVTYIHVNCVTYLGGGCIRQ
jgi:hypothetical protein